MINNIKLGYDDISIVPECVSNIRSRKECSFFTETLSLPIFAAPMDTVVNEECAVNFIESSINVVYPRTIPLQRRLELLNICKLNQWSFIAFSLSEAQDIFLNKTKKHDLSYKNTAIKVMREKINCGTLSCNICIDIANGHMVELIDSIKKIKQRYGKKVIIMSGNIANPNTYKKYEEAGCDFVRCSIGSGSRCVCAGTKIRMSNGELKNIEDVAIGDLVKTTDGDFEVINTFNKCTDKTILINNNIECTHDHKFLVVRKTDIPITGRISDDKIKEISFYIEAEKLTDDYLLVSE
jgi:hypothetical protein